MRKRRSESAFVLTEAEYKYLLRKVDCELRNAVKKHPEFPFVTAWMGGKSVTVQTRLRELRRQNDAGDGTQISILSEEMFEMLEAVLKRKWDEAEKEAYHVAAVALRMALFFRTRNNLKIKSEKDNKKGKAK